EDRASGAKSRRWLPLALVVVATLIGILAILAIWAKRQVLETDSWTETSTALLEDEVIRDRLAGFLVDELYDNVDVQAEIAGQLPVAARPLAGPAAGALRQAADEVAKRALERPAVQGLWEDANRTAHQAFIKVVEGGGDNVSTEGGDVVLNLSTILTELTAQLGLPDGLADKLPPDAANLEIIQSDELEVAQDAVDLLETLAWVLTVLALGLYGLAVFVSGERRRETLRSVGFGFVAMGLIVLFVQHAAGNAIVESLAETSAGEPAVANVWEIGTSMLVEGAGAVILYGIAIVFAAWLAGPTRIATRARYALAPYLRQPRLAYAGLLLLLVLLFWWSPTPATDRFLPSLLLIGFLVLGTEMLRRRTAVEFPERVTTASPAGMAQTMAQQTRESISSRVRARAERQESEAAASRLEALERLARLRETGALSEAEFEAEKTRLVDPATEVEQ
ncbi:MAG TPA: SHOCT domain-containing protein, partial [Solirubrobacterales bacterium]|nr:SHOCT domain-containing protein [Solirubrobacterales bacterium]